MGELRWTVKCDSNQMVTAVRVPAAMESWAYITKEANRWDLLSISTLAVAIWQITLGVRMLLLIRLPIR